MTDPDELLSEMARCRETTAGIARTADLDVWVNEATERRARDVLAHIAAWELNASRSLEAFRAGTTFEIKPFDIHAINAEVFEAHRHWEDARVLALLRESHERLTTAARSIAAADWTGPVTYPWGARGSVDELLIDMWKHEQHHRAQVEATQGAR